jgi:hypothetical protein
MTPGTRVQHRFAGWRATVVAPPEPHYPHGLTEKAPLVVDGGHFVSWWTIADLRELGTVSADAAAGTTRA